MGQKVHPIGLRLGINKTWDSRWFSKREFAKNLNEDLNVRKFISKKYAEAGVARVEIERAAKQVVVKVYTAKPGKLIGKQGKGIELLREEVKTVLKSNDKSIKVDVFEVKNPDTNAQLAAFNVAQQLEKRISFRRAMKKVMQQAMKAGGKGIKIRVAGRLNGAEMARTEWYMEGRVPLHTLRADIDYGTSEALTTYGLIGVKVWLFKGEVFGKTAVNPAINTKNTRNEE
ncbi:30S ribosomal protein S3 [Silvanigrella aquatica]|uniref:Small ribosomal subunit protein uS3 n=1 Tax=Silvanigrella aquatica TaxID=1915309 RepID=A0A1L4D2T3_9BACT|nr:30S ribosomal protein S3 [Silvanigrella aquatica]APJ04502.1 30S ribosomal protein S3 [Silvanigrella aquatica]